MHILIVAFILLVLWYTIGPKWILIIGSSIAAAIVGFMVIYGMFFMPELTYHSEKSTPMSSWTEPVPPQRGTLAEARLQCFQSIHAFSVTRNVKLSDDVTRRLLDECVQDRKIND